MDQISAGSVNPLRFSGRLKFSVPLAVMITKNSKGRQNFLGTVIKNLHMEKLRLAIVYRCAKFRDDRTTFRNIEGYLNFFGLSFFRAVFHGIFRGTMLES